MTFITIAKLFLILTIAIKQSYSSVTPEQTSTLKTMFKFPDDSKQKAIYFLEQDVKDMLDDKPTGLNRVVLDLDFPEGPEVTTGTDVTNTPRYRVVQCLAVGQMDYIQHQVYKKVLIKLTPRDPYSDAPTTCFNRVTVTLSPPGNITTDNLLTDVYKIYEKKVTLDRKLAAEKKDGASVLFDNVLNEGFLEPNLFWINFEITGKCYQYMVVDLLKPQNNDVYGNSNRIGTGPFKTSPTKTENTETQKSTTSPATKPAETPKPAKP